MGRDDRWMLFTRRRTILEALTELHVDLAALAGAIIIALILAARAHGCL